MIQVKWLYWQRMSNVLCNHKVFLKFKEKFYKRVVRVIIFCKDEDTKINVQTYKNEYIKNIERKSKLYLLKENPK